MYHLELDIPTSTEEAIETVVSLGEDALELTGMVVEIAYTAKEVGRVVLNEAAGFLVNKASDQLFGKFPRAAF